MKYTKKAKKRVISNPKKGCYKDRHAKVEGRDCRVRLSGLTAARFFQLSDELGHRNNGETIEWLLNHVPPSHFPNSNVSSSTCTSTLDANLRLSLGSARSSVVSSSSNSKAAVKETNMGLKEEDLTMGSELETYNATGNASFVSLLMQFDKVGGTSLT
ncbi:hypothetical protein Pint_32111 [Pistacia integerrima]|uniref:Uncharacterized protein n=1 Tax=Pistacia integerrima TaxID=434235 RepID=A0ACC0XTL2_9ROSI|nr:hypothetical protein Pint_32111 [Pistacia integerrima]